MEEYRVKKINEIKQTSITVHVPGSKSITNRALLLAALAKGESALSGVLFSDDSRHFLDCVQKLGIETKVEEDNCNVTVNGHGGLEKMDMRNAFWNAYMSSLVKALLLYPFSDVNVKQVDDRFNGGTDSGCGLYREKVVAVLSISPFIKDIRNNKLYVDWQITEQQNIIRK